jgi:TonB-like protein
MRPRRVSGLGARDVLSNMEAHATRPCTRQLLELFAAKKIRHSLLVAVLFAMVGGYGCSENPAQPSDPAPAAPTVYEAGTPGLSLPTVVQEVRPKYTAEAIRNLIQGTVLLTAVVMRDGTVGDVNVTRSLDTTYGLDAEAVFAVR